jgi:hypothetical protein
MKKCPTVKRNALVALRVAFTAGRSEIEINWTNLEELVVLS